MEDEGLYAIEGFRAHILKNAWFFHSLCRLMHLDIGNLIIKAHISQVAIPSGGRGSATPFGGRDTYCTIFFVLFYSLVT